MSHAQTLRKCMAICIHNTMHGEEAPSLTRQADYILSLLYMYFED